MQPPDPFRRNRPHAQHGGTEVAGVRDSSPGAARRRKALGQHFLRDQGVVTDILQAAAIRAGERVLEVGPGPGVLTRDLARLAVGNGPSGPGGVVAIETDGALATAIEAEAIPGLTLVQADAVQVDLAALGRFDAIVANLPYVISGPITAAFLALLDNPATRWKRAVLMYQREFALRLLASPGSPDYGRLTVQSARRCRVTRVRDVPPGAFDPPPRVDSMVVRFEPHAKAPFEVRDETVWRALIDGTFQRRRKQLRNSVPAAVGGVGVPQAAALEALEATGWASRRPENLAPAEFAELANRLAVAR